MFIGVPNLKYSRKLIMSEEYNWNKYYYCNGCRQFHHYGSHSVVSAELCMICHQKE